jgi:hypothetical protein
MDECMTAPRMRAVCLAVACAAAPGGLLWGATPAGAGAPAQSAAPAATAPAAVVPGFSFVKSLGGIDEYQLDANGLDVLLAVDSSAPVVTFQVTYRVGSRNEVTGTTGATHILEQRRHLRGAAVSSSDDRLEERYRARADLETA